MITIGIIEDDRDIRTGIQKYLSRQTDFICDIAADSVEDFLAMSREAGLPDVILSDIGLPGMSGIDGIRLIREQDPDVDIIMLTVYNDWQKIFNSLRAGASGYLIKNTPLTEIKQAIETVHNGGSVMSPEIARKVMEHFADPQAAALDKGGETSLTQKEKQIVIGLVDGLSYKLLADRMDVSIDTIRFHIKNVYKKLHVNSKAEVISKSLRGEI
jgi:DNA-binding NarL/FixJ family response regulator